jgi:membrane protein
MAERGGTDTSTRGAERGREAQKPTQIPPRGWKDVLTRVKAETKNDNVPLLAAGLAYYAILSIFPAIIAAITLWGLFADPGQLQQQITSLLQPLPQQAQDAIRPVLESATTGAGAGLSIGAIAGLAGVLWSASGGMAGMIKGVNAAYDEEETRGFLKVRGLALALTLGALVVGVIALGLIAVLPAVLDTLGLGSVGQFLARWLRWPVLFVLVAAALAVIYRLAPDRDDPKLQWVSWGAVVATVLWLIGSGLFSLYVSNFGDYGATYGALAGVIILLLWLFLTGFVVLLGAEINAEMERQTRRDTTSGQEQPMGDRRAQAADTVGDPAS